VERRIFFRFFTLFNNKTSPSPRFDVYPPINDCPSKNSIKSFNASGRENELRFENRPRHPVYAELRGPPIYLLYDGARFPTYRALNPFSNRFAARRRYAARP